MEWTVHTPVGPLATKSCGWRESWGLSGQGAQPSASCPQQRTSFINQLLHNSIGHEIKQNFSAHVSPLRRALSCPRPRRSARCKVRLRLLWRHVRTSTASFECKYSLIPASAGCSSSFFLTPSGGFFGFLSRPSFPNCFLENSNTKPIFVNRPRSTCLPGITC